MLQSWLFSGGLPVVCIVLIWNDMIYIFKFVFLFSIFSLPVTVSLYVTVSLCTPKRLQSCNCLPDCGRGLGTNKWCILVIKKQTNKKKTIWLTPVESDLWLQGGIHINKLTTSIWTCRAFIVTQMYIMYILGQMIIGLRKYNLFVIIIRVFFK